MGMSVVFTSVSKRFYLKNMLTREALLLFFGWLTESSIIFECLN